MCSGKDVIADMDLVAELTQAFRRNIWALIL